MNVSSSGQITLIHAGTPECYYHAYNYSSNSKTILRAEVTSNSNEGEGKAWTKYGNNLAQSIHYMTDIDYSLILKNKNGNENYYLRDFLDNNERGTCYNIASSDCGQNYDLIDTGAYYWLASADSSTGMNRWNEKYQSVDRGSNYSYGVRPVIILKSTVKIKSDNQDGSPSSPYNLTT